MRCRKPGWLCLCLIAGLLVISQSQCLDYTPGPPGEDWRQSFLDEFGNQHLIPVYSALAREAGGLREASAAFCDSLDATSFALVKETWVSTRSLLKRAEVFGLGPYKEYPWRLGPKLDLWPVRPGEIEATLTTEPWATSGNLSAVTGFSKGTPAMEYLLYGTTPEGQSAFERLTSQPSACTYLTLLGEDVARNALALFNAWSPEGDDYLSELISGDEGSLLYKGSSQAFAAILNQLGFTVENMREVKLAKPAGFSSASPQPNLLESPISGRALDDLRNNLLGVEEIFVGAYFLGTGGGIVSLIDPDHAAIGDSIIAAIAEVNAALSDIDTALAEAVVAQSPKLRILYEALKKLQRLIQVDLSHHLAVTVTFNDTDGD